MTPWNAAECISDILPKGPSIYKDALQAAEAALREKAARENPLPLSMEQLRAMHGKPVWCVNHRWLDCNDTPLGQWGIVKNSSSEIRLWGPELIVEIVIQKGRIPRDRQGRKINGNYIFYASKPGGNARNN